MPGKKRISPVPAKIKIVDDNGIPTIEFTRYLMEMIGIDPMQAFPVGTILAFSGEEDDIPENWLICDGTNGTPDLYDRFLLGAVVVGDIGDTGGYAEPQLLSHDHSIDHNHGAKETTKDGEHTHTYTNYPGYNGYTSQDEDGWQINEVSGAIESTSEHGGHTHEVNLPEYTGNSGTEKSGDQDFGNFPPFYKVVYIIKIEPVTRRRR